MMMKLHQKKLPSILLLCTLFLFQHSTASQNQEKPVHILQRNVQLSNGTFAPLIIENGIEPVDAIYGFVSAHQVTSEERVVLQEKVCDIIECERSKAIVWRKNVVVGGVMEGADGPGVSNLELSILEGEEPVDVIHAFVKTHNLNIGNRASLLAEACAICMCSRMKPGTKSLFILLLKHVLYYENILIC